MDWETTEEEQMCQDLDKFYFSSQSNQSRNFSDRGRNDSQSGVEKERREELIGDIVAAGRAAVRSSAAASSAAQEASELEKSEAEKETRMIGDILEAGRAAVKSSAASSAAQDYTELEKSEVEKELMMIRDIVAAGRAAVRSSLAASSAAQEASLAAATAAQDAKTALEEVEKLMKILDGHKCHQQMSFPTTKMSDSQKDVNCSAHFDSSTKTLTDRSDDEAALEVSSNPINCDQKAKNSGAKDTISVKEKVTQIFKAYKLHVKFESGGKKYKV